MRSRTGERSAVESTDDDAPVTPSASNSARSAPAVFSKSGATSSLPSGSASQVCRPDIDIGAPRSSSGVRSEWTMPRPAVIRFTSPAR